jgi:hypothetical protein
MKTGDLVRIIPDAFDRDLLGDHETMCGICIAPGHIFGGVLGGFKLAKVLTHKEFRYVKEKNIES